MRFKKQVFIGGFGGCDLEGLVKALIGQTEENNAIDEVKAILHKTLVELVLRYPNSKSLRQICEEE